MDSKPSPSEDERFEQLTEATDRPIASATFSSRTVLCCLASCLSILTTVFGISATGGYGALIATELGNAADTPWLTNAGQIIQCSLGPPVSLYADKYGRKPFLLFGLTMGAVGAIVSCTATNISVGIVGAVLTGLMFSAQGLAVAIVSEVLPRRQRTMMQAIFNVSSSTGGSLGLIVGGFLVRYNAENWRWIYRVLAILYGCTAMFVLVGYRPLVRRPNVSAITKRTGVWVADLGGAALLTAASVCFYTGLVYAENPYPWSDAHVLGPLCTAIALFAAFGFYEWKFVKDGILHHGLFSRSRNYAMCLVLVFIEGIMFFSFNGFWARSAGLIFHLTTFEAGLRFVVFFGVSIFVTPAVGWASRRYQEVKYLLIAGWICFLISAIGMATVNTTDLVSANIFAAIAGIGFSSPLTLVAACAQLAAPPELLATASNNLLVGRALGGVFSISLYNAVYKSLLSQKLGPYLTQAVQPLGFAQVNIAKLATAAATENAAAMTAVPGVTAEILQAALVATQRAYADSFRWIWVLAAPFGIIAVVLSWFLEDVKPMMTAKTDAPAEVAATPLKMHEMDMA